MSGYSRLAVALGRGLELFGSSGSSWALVASWVRPCDPPVVLRAIMVSHTAEQWERGECGRTEAASHADVWSLLEREAVHSRLP
jgi:hypothetical protein